MIKTIWFFSNYQNLDLLENKISTFGPEPFNLCLIKNIFFHFFKKEKNIKIFYWIKNLFQEFEIFMQVKFYFYAKLIRSKKQNCLV